MTENESTSNEEKALQTNGEESNNTAHEDETTNGDAEKKSDAPNGIVDKTRAKAADIKKHTTETKQKAQDKANPPGGHDETPIPKGRDGYTLRFTFHRAENLPVADLQTQSADPFLTATLTAPGIQPRHKEDPVMRLRTKTIQKTKAPEWNEEWVVAGVPSSGFKLKCRLYDEDPDDHDDRLGNVTIHVDHVGEDWKGIREEGYEIKKRMGSKRAYAWKACISLVTSTKFGGTLYVSIEVLGKSDPKYLGRMYTLGPCRWTKHTSPMIGRLLGTKVPENQQKAGENGKGKEKGSKYDFQATQFQLQGPVPEQLYHRYVEFKPFVKGMFSGTGLRGRILHKALHHQHDRVYNYSPTTVYGAVKPHSLEASQKFLELVHWDEGARIFTYVLSLDGLLRFTETGKEFGIDLLSKHTMHSDVSVYIACSGEFFVRRLSKPDKPADAPEQKTHPSDNIPGGPPNEAPPKVPKDYVLHIDNDSGTYRPQGDLLHYLKEFLVENFPEMHVETGECTDDKLQDMKKEQREMKKKEGQHVTMVQDSDGDGEISESDEERLNDAGDGPSVKKSKRTRAYEALEDPVKAAKELVHGGSGGGENSK